MADTVTYTDHFESYSENECMQQPNRTFGALWSGSCCSQFCWHIGVDGAAAPANGQFANIYGPPNSTTHESMSFSLLAAHDLKGLTIEFDYLVQTSCDLQLEPCIPSCESAPIPVAFDFVNQANSGEIVDSTGTIDLSGLIPANTTAATIRFVGECVNSSHSHIRIDNFEFTVTTCPTDINDDTVVGIADLLSVIGAWGPCAGCPKTPCEADTTDDCSVGIADLLAVIGAWGACP